MKLKVSRENVAAAAVVFVSSCDFSSPALMKGNCFQTSLSHWRGHLCII
jgi:hypothetical protein